MSDQNRLRCLNRPTRRAILAWADACGIDVDNESADTLVRRLHDETIPFEGHPDIVERSVVEALRWMADRAEDGNALQGAAEVVGKAFESAEFIGGVAQPEPASPKEADTAPAETLASDEPLPRSIRFDTVYCQPVEIRLADGQRGNVVHPPFDACVRVKPERGCTVVVALDDLPAAARAVLRSPVRKRVEVHPRCSVPGCGQAFRGFLTADGAVELSDGEYICDFDSLFHGYCPDHKRVE
jgi:hypothetical protein